MLQENQDTHTVRHQLKSPINTTYNIAPLLAQHLQASVKPSQHVNTTYRTIVGTEFASFSQTIATCQHNISHHCWHNICKLQSNDRNMSTERIAPLLAQHLQASVKRSQHVNTTYRTIVGTAFASFSQTIATFQRNMAKNNSTKGYMHGENTPQVSKYLNCT